MGPIVMQKQNNAVVAGCQGVKFVWRSCGIVSVQHPTLLVPA
jgi:hypothetical protein